jgi:hypothetical protein
MHAVYVWMTGKLLCITAQMRVPVLIHCCHMASLRSYTDTYQYGISMVVAVANCYSHRVCASCFIDYLSERQRAADLYCASCESRLWLV